MADISQVTQEGKYERANTTAIAHQSLHKHLQASAPSLEDGVTTIYNIMTITTFHQIQKVFQNGRIHIGFYQ